MDNTRHARARACFVSADGYVILWDFHNCDRLSAHLPLVREPAGSNRRLAVDKIEIAGLRALDDLSFTITHGLEVTKLTHVIKRAD